MMLIFEKCWLIAYQDIDCIIPLTKIIMLIWLLYKGESGHPLIGVHIDTDL